MSDNDILGNAHWHLADVKEASFKHAVYENGMPMLRVTVKEGKRITLYDIHPGAAKQMGEIMIKWAAANQDE
jgi:hypothetical protein